MKRLRIEAASRNHRVVFGAVSAVALCLAATMAQGQPQDSGNEAAAAAQLQRPSGPRGESAPVTLTLKDALDRARHNDAQYLSAVTDARSAHQDRVQTRAALLPSAGLTTQELLTEGNGVLPSGRYVTNDGIHVYRAWGVFHQDLSPSTLMLTAYRRASAAEALAQARAEVAGRGLTVTVTKDYYDLAVAQRQYSAAQESLDQANRFLAITRDLERGGEAAHSDVIKAQLQTQDRERAFEEVKLGMENGRLALAVLIFPALNENFSIVDDLDQAPSLPPFTEAQSLAATANPDLRAALAALREANLDVSAARASFLPSVTLDTDFGIEANSFALSSRVSADLRAGRLPNVGAFITASLVLPVWDWGSLRSKLKQAGLRREQARAELSQTQRLLLERLYSLYNEASVAQAAVDSLRQSSSLADDSLRLNTLRYQAGEASVLEVVDAQNVATQARDAYAAGEARYRVALANLQTLTGSF